MSVLETQRLIIRGWENDDLDDAAAMYGDRETMRFIPCGALSREQSLNLITRMRERAEQYGFGIWAVEEKRCGQVIGECGLTYIPEHGTDIEIAWIFRSAYQGQGYATEAARGVLEFARNELRLTLVYALIDRGNARSIALSNRLGMVYDRVVRAYNRDLMRYRTAWFPA